MILLDINKQDTSLSRNVSQKFTELVYQYGGQNVV